MGQPPCARRLGFYHPPTVPPLPEQPVVREGAGRGAGTRLPPSGAARPRAGLALNPPPALFRPGRAGGGGSALWRPLLGRALSASGGVGLAARALGAARPFRALQLMGWGRCLSARSSASSPQRLSSAYRAWLLVGHPIRVLDAEPFPAPPSVGEARGGESFWRCQSARRGGGACGRASRLAL